MSASQSLTEQEMTEILENLARNSGSATARIQAIKLLREMRDGELTPAEGFDQLDSGTVKPFLRQKQSA